MNIMYVSVVCIAITFTANAAFAGNPCNSLLCMAGKLQGQNGGSDCNQPIADYLSILKFGKHGRFSPGNTATARLNFLNSCQAQGAGEWPARINAVYGTVRN